MTFQHDCTALGPDNSNADVKEHNTCHAHTHTHWISHSNIEGWDNKKQKLYPACFRGVWFLWDYFLISNRVQKAESGLSSVSGLSGAYRQSTVRSADSGTVIELFTVTDLSIDLILVIVVLKDPKVWAIPGVIVQAEEFYENPLFQSAAIDC